EELRQGARRAIPKFTRSIFGTRPRRGGDIGYVAEWGLFVHASKKTFLPKYRDHVGRKYVLGASPFMSSRKRVVICGGGAIGAAVAYFESRRGALPIVIERHEVAGAASGKSGGFLALDWCSGTPLDPLARRSFDLHAELSSELGNPWGYRPLTTYAGYAVE